MRPRRSYFISARACSVRLSARIRYKSEVQEGDLSVLALRMLKCALIAWVGELDVGGKKKREWVGEKWSLNTCRC